jgi:hypothetical protein
MLAIKAGLDAPVELPGKDVDSEGRIWTGLPGSAEAREACGWTLVDDPPAYDPTSEAPTWVNGAWSIVSTIPSVVSGLQLELELASRGWLDHVLSLVAFGGPTLEIYWRRTQDFHINHPKVIALNAAGIQAGFWADGDLDDVFTAAKQRI